MGRLHGVVSVVLVLVAACGEDEVVFVDAGIDAPVIDAPVDGPDVDAAVIDAATDAAIDAAVIDAATDAAVIDAATDAAVDAAMVDAPTDAPTDATLADAALADAADDAAPADAPTDARDVDATEADAAIDAFAGQMFRAGLTPLQEVQNPPVASTASGNASCTLLGSQLQCNVTVSMLSAVQAAHIHGPAGAGQNAGVAVGFTLPVTDPQTFNLTSQQVADLEAGRQYINIHTAGFGGGEIRGQLIRQTETLFSTQMTAIAAGVGFTGCVVVNGHTQLRCTGSALALAQSATSVQLLRPDKTVAMTFTIDTSGTNPLFSGTYTFAGIEAVDFETSPSTWTVRLDASGTSYLGTFTQQ